MRILRSLGRAKWWLAAGLLTLGGAATFGQLGGCYNPSLDGCHIACTPASGCPGGYSCRGDGFCHSGGPDDSFSECTSGGGGGDGGSDGIDSGITPPSDGPIIIYDDSGVDTSLP